MNIDHTMFSDPPLVENDLVRLYYFQDPYTQAEDDLCSGGACADYELPRSVYGRVSGTAPAAGVNIEVAETDIVTICEEGCLDAADGAFSGVCQLTGGCLHQGAADCTTALFQGNPPGTESELRKITGLVRCAVASSVLWGDAGKTCLDQGDDLCEAMIVSATPGDIMKLTYHQPQSSANAQGQWCADDGAIRGAVDACEEYTKTDIFVKIVEGSPIATEAELSPSALLAICTSPCLNTESAFNGICQSGEAGVSTCETPRENAEEVCDINLWGTLSYEIQEEPTEEPTEEPPITEDVTEAPVTITTSDAVIASFGLSALLLAA